MRTQQAKTDVLLVKCCHPSLPVLSWFREQWPPGTLELAQYIWVLCTAPCCSQRYASRVMSIRKLKPTASPCIFFLPGKKKASFWKSYRMQPDKFSFWVGGFVASADFIPFRTDGFPAREMRKEAAQCPCASSADSSLLFLLHTNTRVSSLPGAQLTARMLPGWIGPTA